MTAILVESEKWRVKNWPSIFYLKNEMLKKYISIEQQDYEISLKKIKDEAGTSRLRTLHPPYNLSCNKKVLTLYYSDNKSYVKVDGPEFLLDKLFEYFS